MKNIKLIIIIALSFTQIINSFAKSKVDTVSTHLMGINSVYFIPLENRQSENMSHTAYNNISTKLDEGSTYYLYMNAYGYDQFSSIWIDYNDNNILEENEKVINRLFLNGIGGFSIAPILVKEANGLNKTVRLRIKTEYAYTDTNTVDSPYSIPVFGEIHDFYVEINPKENQQDNKTVLVELEELEEEDKSN